MDGGADRVQRGAPGDGAAPAAPITLDTFRAETRGTGIRCTLSLFLPHLTREERRELAAALEDQSISSQAIARVLQRRGFRHSEQVILRHRGDRPCPACDAVPR